MRNLPLSQQLTIQQALSQAKKATKKGKIADAVELYNAVLQRQPNHPIAKKRLNKLQKELPRDRSAQEQTTQPSQVQIDALVNLYQTGQMAKVELACGQLLKSYPQSLAVINILGAALRGQGKLQEAVQAYNRAIKLKPDFASAYSNRGNALKDLGRLDEAVASYDKAIQLKPDFADAYSNRGNALIDLDRLDEAVASCDKAIQLKPDFAQAHFNRGVVLQELGQLGEAMRSFDKAIQLKPDYPEAYSNRGNALKALGLPNKALKSYDKAIQLKPDYAEAYHNKGVTLQELEQLDEAVESYNKAIQLKPDYAEAYSNRGNTLQDLGRLDEALASYNKAIQLKPDYAGAYNNRGIALKDLGFLDEALKSYDKAIQFKPDYADAYNNRGSALKDLGRLDEAVASYDKAIQLKPDYAVAHFNRGGILQELGRFQLAMTSCQKAVSINPHEGLFWAGYASSLQGVKFESYNDELGHYLLQVLEQPTVRPVNVSVAAIKALHYHPVISRILTLSESDHFDEDIDHLTEQLSTVPLLLRVMELSSIADLEVEKMLTKMRQAMLHKAARGGGEALGIPFSAALAMHCFTNEYVFFESEEEKEGIALLQENVKVILENEGTVSPTWIAVLGAYRPLYSFSWADALLKTEWLDEIQKVIVEQVDNVREEQTLRSKIPRLNSIDDKVSQLVRNQYEENPYPRWVNTGLTDKPTTTRQVLQSVNPHLNFDVQQFSNKPDILIAGCGTGQHALGRASGFRNCNVLAIDLSLTSLSYAKRKTQELGIKNIEYMQGDILKLDQLDREFDIVECVGVLHHMDDPLAGWKVLVGMLRRGGLMKVGLYSEIARQNIVNARKDIAKKEYTSSPDDIRRYRAEIMNIVAKSDLKIFKATDYHDFFTLSECRDLLFHVQEHRFTLPQIEVALNDLGLKFLGFQLEKSWIRNEFSKLYPEKDALVSLPLWHQFELKNPNTFRGMYQFWAQKA